MPLTVKRDALATGPIFQVYSGEAQIGIIMQHVEHRGSPWRWIIHFPSSNRPIGTAMNGHGVDYEDCKRQLGEAWRAWLEFAGLVEK
jgi:hypothetical protein